MTVSTVVNHIQQDRPVAELPAGVLQWNSYGEVTGSSGSGTMGVLTQFNPGGNRGFEAYVAVHSITIRASVADPTDGFWFPNTSDWERQTRSGVGIQMPAKGTLVTSVFDSDIWLAQFVGWTMLGRAETGTLGRISVLFPEINTSVLQVYAEGLISDRPFIVPTDMVV